MCDLLNLSLSVELQCPSSPLDTPETVKEIVSQIKQKVHLFAEPEAF